MKKAFFIILLVLSVFTYSGCAKETELYTFVAQGFRGDYIYNLENNYSIFKGSSEYFLIYNYQDLSTEVIYEGNFVRFAVLDSDNIVIENKYVFEDKSYDEYALINLAKDFNKINDVKIKKYYDLQQLQKELTNENLQIEKWEIA